jgi:hypothetical protein
MQRPRRKTAVARAVTARSKQDEVANKTTTKRAKVRSSFLLFALILLLLIYCFLCSIV